MNSLPNSVAFFLILYKNSTVKSIRNTLQNILLVLVVAVGIYFVAAVVLSLLKTRPQEVNCVERLEVYVHSNGVHIDIIVPIESLENTFSKALQLPRGTTFVGFGWGDKNFYINTPEWKDLSFSTTIKALFLKSETAMHVTAYSRVSPAWRKTEICPAQLNRLVLYITRSFAKDAEGKISQINVQGYGPNDSFFDATGSFSLFKTCNVWVNQALKQSAIETSIWSPFDFGVLHHLPQAKVERQNY